MKAAAAGALALLLVASATPALALALDDSASVGVTGAAESSQLGDESVTLQTRTGDIVESPEQIAVTGTIELVPGEPVDGADSPDTLLVRTDEGILLRVDQQASGAALPLGGTITATARLSDDVRDTVAEQIAQNGSIDAAGVQFALASSAPAAGVVLEGVQADPAPQPPTGPVGEAPTGGATSAKSHTIDVVYYQGPNRSFSDAQIKTFVGKIGPYWKTQSNGLIPSVKLGTYKRTSSPGWCDWDTTWNDAFYNQGMNTHQYGKGTARHLIVIIDGDCGDTFAGYAGHGQSMHDGGPIWLNLGSWSQPMNSTSASVLDRSLLALVHEFGHNLSLGHAQARVCSGSAIDAKTSWQDDEQNSGIFRVKKPHGNGCQDLEYGDWWNVMGGSGSATKPVSLGIAQRTALGVNPKGSVKTVSAKNGASQEFTINALGTNKGLRGLKIDSPSGEDLYVELRTASGQDSQGLWDSQGKAYPSIYITGNAALAVPGVQVSKSYPVAQYFENYGGGDYHTLRSTVLTHVRSSGDFKGRKVTALAAGESITPIDSTVKVSVRSWKGNTAKVRVDFQHFLDVPYTHKFGKEIGWMKSSGLSTGIQTPAGVKYAPKSKVSREAMAAFIYRLEGRPKFTAPKKSPFKDMKPSSKFYKEITWMYAEGLTTGIKSGSGKIYAPKRGVSREAMAAFIYRLEGATYKGAKTSPFADVKKGQKFYKEITWMKSTGLSTGIKQKSGKPKYASKDRVSREAMAAFIYRLEH